MENNYFFLIIYVDYLLYVKFVLGIGVIKLGEIVFVFRNNCLVEDILRERFF